jgi:hypothetical protein
LEAPLIGGIFAACLIWSFSMASVGWNHSLSDSGGFRQTQTAITSYYLAHGSPVMRYETPVLGPPWSIPFEFPLYQWIVARTANVFGTPLHQTGRFVNELFFVLSLLLLWATLSEFDVRFSHKLVFLTLVLVSPEYLFWSRTFMIESTAVFFCLGYLLFAVRYVRTRKVVDAFAGGLFGAVASLVKLTTLPAFALVACAVYLFRARRDFRQLHSSKILQHALGLVAFGVTPLVAGGLWVRFADQVKSLNVVALLLTSAALKVWNFGTLQQRFSLETWTTLFSRIVPDLLGTSMILLVPVLGFCLTRRRIASALLCSGGFLATFLTFTNLHVIHDYYPYANGAFLLAAVGWSIVGLLEGNGWQKYVGGALFAVCVASSVWGYYARIYTIQTLDPPYLIHLGREINAMTGPEDVVLVLGHDWSSEVPYYSQRRALMWPKWMGEDFDSPQMKTALARLAGFRLGALVVRKSGTDPRLVESAINSLGFSEKAEYDDSAWSIRRPRGLAQPYEQDAAKSSDPRSALAKITASPNPIPPGSGPGKTTITWATGDQTWGEVYVAVNDGPEQPFMQGASGAADAPWIGAGSIYEFRLYAKDNHSRPLGTVRVIRADK